MNPTTQPIIIINANDLPIFVPDYNETECVRSLTHLVEYLREVQKKPQSEMDEGVYNPSAIQMLNLLLEKNHITMLLYVQLKKTIDNPETEFNVVTKIVE